MFRNTPPELLQFNHKNVVDTLTHGLVLEINKERTEELTYNSKVKLWMSKQLGLFFETKEHKTNLDKTQQN